MTNSTIIIVKTLSFILTLCLCTTGFAQDKDLQTSLMQYRENLDLLRKEHRSVRDMPDIKFFLFGMGDRPKMIYKDGNLKDALTGKIIKGWKVKNEIIVPSEYTVALETADGKRIKIFENERGVFYSEGKKLVECSKSNIKLPQFEGYKYGPVLRVLHHEILINIIDGKPVPNFFVYSKPWFRDATLMGMVLKETGNLDLIKDWIMNIRDPFDRNNHGISEADNPGQVLFLISLVSDTSHPAVKIALDSVNKFKKQDYIEGKTDYHPHPVFQTKWIKFGLKSIGLQNIDSYKIPVAYDTYSSLFWWDYKDQHVNGARFNLDNNTNYPYLVWAEDHFFSEQKGIMTNRDYPLSWEGKASDADYKKLSVLDESLVKEKLSPPHTWHAAEMFLLLNEIKK